ncbi:hypothetical protein AAFF_G00260500 [Aldrovandia affinis]|uniref:Homeobox domain-containing protein n=1 Tax=Aldrovandia affinis TaxID=143900 RepID=A0AAD7W2M1_9TELE|nr:hypothetical protein AAFF_G00260500 [Aldrovandia affinis]
MIPVRDVKREAVTAGFGTSGKSFLIDNLLLRCGGSPVAPPARMPLPVHRRRPPGRTAQDGGLCSPPGNRATSRTTAEVSSHSLTQVKIWFQNRRMKWRNSKEKEAHCVRPSGEEQLQRCGRGTEEHWPRETNVQLETPRLSADYPSAALSQQLKELTAHQTRPSQKDISASWT